MREMKMYDEREKSHYTSVRDKWESKREGTRRKEGKE